MPQVRIDAPSKLNLHLNVGKKRPDGFHDIQSLFLALAYGDTLSFEVFSEKSDFLSEKAFSSENTEIILDWQLPWGGPKDLSPDKNIINRAVVLFRERTGFDKRLKIVLEKRIPLGGGLGGGSSDAAAALLALNRLAADDGKGLNGTDLLEMGASLGSDVPFFLQTALNCTPIAWVSGRGERVQPFSMPPQMQNFSILLVNPGFPSDTAKAFKLLDELRDRHQVGSGEWRHCRLGVGSRGVCPQDVCPSKITEILSNPPREWCFTNDFLQIFETGFKQEKPDGGLFSACWEIISTLKKLGADFSGLSGSGSTCFGVFTSPDSASTAKGTLLLRWNFVIETFYLRSKQLSATIYSK